VSEEDGSPEIEPGLMGVLRRYRRPLSVIGLLWFTGVLGAGIFISGMEPSGGLHVFGSPQFVAGEPAQLRVVLRDLQERQPLALETLDATFSDQSGLDGPTQTLSQPAIPFVQGTLSVPGRSGDWILALAAENPQGPVTAELPITVHPGVETVPLPSPPKPQPPMQPDRGPIKFEIRPMDGVMPGGLPSRLVLSTRTENGPISTTVTLKTTEGRSKKALPTTVTTDAHGRALIPVEPMHPIFTFELSAGESWAVRRVKHTNTQFTMLVPSSNVRSGKVPIVVKSLHGKGTLFADVWDGERWLFSVSKPLIGGTSSLMLPLPTPGPTPRLLWIEVYRDAYLPGEARAGRWVVSSMDPDAGIEWARGALVKAGYAIGTDKTSAGLRIDLGQLARPPHSPMLLADSTETARQSVSALKIHWQGKFTLALSLSGLGFFILILIALVRHQRHLKAQWTLAGGDEDGDGPARERIMMDAGYLFLILAVYLAGLVHLLQTIRW